MKVLVIGGGGREHALAWKLAASPKVQLIYVAPGNGGTARDGRLQNVNITEVKALREWALNEKIALTVVGPEAPLAAGVVDEFRAHGLRVFGPTQAARIGMSVEVGNVGDIMTLRFTSSALAILFGAEFNAELERGRAVAGGHPIEEEPFSELRDDRKLRKKEKGSRQARRHGGQAAQ